MLGAIIAVIAGLSIKRLWPQGVVFLVLWPAIAVAITLPIVAHNRAELGESLELTPAFLGISYAQTAIIAAVIFLITYGIRRLVDGRSKMAKDVKDIAKD